MFQFDVTSGNVSLFYFVYIFCCNCFSDIRVTPWDSFGNLQLFLSVKHCLTQINTTKNVLNLSSQFLPLVDTDR